MSTRKAFAIHTIQYKDGDNLIERPAGWVGDLPSKVFEDLEAHKAVRKPTEEDAGRAKDRGLNTDDAGTQTPVVGPETTPLTAYHIGGGKWGVKRGETVVSGDNKFDNKEAAETWATENADAGLTENLLS